MSAFSAKKTESLTAALPASGHWVPTARLWTVGAMERAVRTKGAAGFIERIFKTTCAFTNNAFDSEGKSLLEGVTSVTFAAQGAKTKLTSETRMVGKASYAAQMLAGMEAGWNHSLDRLADLVAKS